MPVMKIEYEEAARVCHETSRMEPAASGLPPALSAASEEAFAFAQPRLEKIRRKLDADRSTLLLMVNAARDENLSRGTRMAWLYELADHLNQAAGPLSACAAGNCSHCCYTPVSLSALEAKLIGAAIGVAPQAPPLQAEGRHAAAASRPGPGRDYTQPCPFLVEDDSLPPGKGGRCSIHAHRPLVCRCCLSLAPSGALCELQREHPVPIPMFDARVLHLLSTQIGGADAADIRDFFPSGLATGAA
jgi:Fe-S-cluster containining protein